MPKKSSSSDDSPRPVPVILKRVPIERKEKKEEEQAIKRPEDTTLRKETRIYRQEQLSLDKIVEDSESKFYLAGSSTKLAFTDLLDLVEKHDVGSIRGLDKEDIVISSRLLAEIARAEVVEEDEDTLGYIDAAVVGIFSGILLFSIYALLTGSLAEIRSVAWVAGIVALVLLAGYIYRGAKTGFYQKFMRAWLQRSSRGK